MLSSHDGRWIAVEDLFDTGEYETVYNLRVSDYHTYFVGSLEWGFTVWSHNACSRYHERSSQEVASLREEFNSLKGSFVRKYALSSEAARRFTPQQIAKMTRTGQLPDGWIIHHMRPLFRGGDNSFENFRVMPRAFHQRHFQRLHWYEPNYNPYARN